MKIGIFTVSMPEYTPERALEVASAIGYDGLEWRVTADAGDTEHPSFWSGNRTSMTAEVLQEKAPALRELADDLGMEMPSLGSYVSCFDFETVEHVFRAANAIGAKAARINVGGYDPAVSFREQIAKNREQYGKIEKLAARYKVKALAETHMGLLCPTVISTLEVLDGLDPDHVGIMWDPGNQVEEGTERYNMAIRAAGPYLAEVHVKNRAHRQIMVENGRLAWQVDNVQLQYGEVNWPAVISELKLNGYNGWLILEDFSSVQPIDARLKNNLEFLRGPCGVECEK